MLALATAMVLCACRSVDECPAYVVTVDASTDTLPATGYGSPQECAKFCDVYHQVCQRVAENRVRCMAGCG
jgi:hypothetical protein